MRSFTAFQYKNKATEQYLKLFTAVAEFIEFDLKKEKFPNFEKLIDKLENKKRLKPIFEESKAMGIDTTDVVLYVLERLFNSDFEYPFEILAGDQLNLIQPVPGTKVMGCSRRMLTPDEQKEFMLIPEMVSSQYTNTEIKYGDYWSRTSTEGCN